jgi:AraC-like DNA-binding protein
MGDNSGQVVRFAEYAGMRVSERLHDGGEALARHAHDSLQLCVVLEGGFFEEFDGGGFECAPSTIMVRPPRADHQDVFRAPSVRTLLVELLSGSPRFAPFFAAAPVPVRLPAVDCVRDAVRELRAADVASPMALEGLLLRLAAQTLRHCSEPRAAAWLDEVKRRIDQLLPRRVDDSTLAAERDVSRSRLFETFRRLEGKSIGDYVTGCRVERARELLAGSRAPLSQVAEACGFADQSHFTRVFRRETGETPKQFRSRNVRAGVQSRDSRSRTPLLPGPC